MTLKTKKGLVYLSVLLMLIAASIFHPGVYYEAAQKEDSRLDRETPNGRPRAGNKAAQNFTVYDAMLFIGKPDLTQYGLSPNWIEYTGGLWPIDNPDYSEPNEAAVRAAADRLVNAGYVYPAKSPVQLDIEHWELDIRAVPQSEVDTSLAKYRQIIGWYKNQVPQGFFKNQEYDKVGYYSLTPIRDYWTPVLNDPAEVAKWKTANDYLAPLTSEVGATYPSIYTFYPLDDPNAGGLEGWAAYARGNIAEARRVAPGKPVYPFLWMQYHDSAGPLALQYIAHDFWLAQLQIIKDAGADGVIIWGGIESESSAARWNENRGWWRATKKFMATLNQTCPDDISTDR